MGQRPGRRYVGNWQWDGSAGHCAWWGEGGAEGRAMMHGGLDMCHMRRVRIMVLDPDLVISCSAYYEMKFYVEDIEYY